MAATAEKLRWTNKARDLAGILSRVRRDCNDAYKAYFSRGFNSGGADPIIDSDLNTAPSVLDVTAAEMADLVTFFDQLDKLFSNQAVTQGDYAATLAKVRPDL